MRNQKLLFKLIIIAGLVLGSLIPLYLIDSIIAERQNRRTEVEKEISQTWGESQDIVGPVLVIPYKYSNTTKKVDDENEKVPVIFNIYILPDDLSINNEILPQIRYRDIYQAVVYSTNLKFQGSFTIPNFSGMNIEDDDILWDKAYLVLNIPDMRGIKNEVKCNWYQRNVTSMVRDTLTFLPGMRGDVPFKSGIHLDIPYITHDRNNKYSFNFSLGLNGSKSISFAPLGKVNKFNVKSSWQTPSFSGSFLPTKRIINENGFESEWEISYFGRTYPQYWLTSSFSDAYIKDLILKSSPEINLIVPVDAYQKTTRSVKYGILFIALTFLAFFLIELLTDLKIHPLQYILVGLALSLFYLLLLSLSEQWSFFSSFLLAGLGNILLISLYVMSILRSKSKGFMLAGILAVLYGFLYILLQIESYALLAGSIGLFLILAIVMYLTRKIDWYNQNVK
ncbi:MAG: Cell envelope integrity protein CreD [Ignavibacteria bacterium]|nr:Cell envelope integrity protein CreD [Ignavibacteria bacterium]